MRLTLLRPTLLLILMGIFNAVSIAEANMTESREFMKGKILRVAIIHVIKFRIFICSCIEIDVK